MNDFPKDFDGNLTGFGGDRTKNKDEHRAALKKTPVILVHGNAGHSAHPTWGMQPMKKFLSDFHYDDCHIWAMDYLGENNGTQIIPNVHKDHIEKFRVFVDRVKKYLGVEKVDIIAHSLGCGMTNGYLRGLQSDGNWDNSKHRLNAVSTFVSLAGATYGLGPLGPYEFKTGSEFEIKSHRFNDIVDDTPHGEDTPEEMKSPNPDWAKKTTLDNDGICYVAISARGDFVDFQFTDTGRREGADLNARFNLGSGFDGHEKIIKSSTVFDTFKGYLNRNPPVAPTRITVDKASGSYGPNLNVSVSVEPSSTVVSYVAERVTREFQAGFVVRTVAETLSGTLANGQSLTLATGGAWEVVFRAAGTDDVARTYGVNVVLPEIDIQTDNSQPFRGTLNVAAKVTRGTLYHSTDREHWMLGAEMVLNRTATVSFIAIDSNGVPSVIQSRAYRKQDWEDQQTASITAHFLAGRLSVNDYTSLGLELGFNAVITLYLIDGKWLRNPEGGITPELAPRRMAAVESSPQDMLSASQPSGGYGNGFDVTLSSAAAKGKQLTVYYTEDGSDPSDENNPNRSSFDTAKAFTIQGSGPHAILCYVEDGTGRGTFQSFAWSVDGHD